MIQAEVLSVTKEQAEALDSVLLDENQRVKLLPATEYAKLDRDVLRAWCGIRARYVLPTTELVEWLKQEIGSKTALEIGAGQGDLGRLLGIPMTDSYQQVNDPATVAYFKLLSPMGTMPTHPPPDVAMEDGEQAVRQRKPQVVIAAYVTEKHVRGRDRGNYKGIRYDHIIERCEKFILIGSLPIHGKNCASKLKHQELHFPWLVTRTPDQAMSRIWLWTR